MKGEHRSRRASRPSPHASAPSRLRLEGTQIFDQFGPLAFASDDPKAPKPSLRLPLLRRHAPQGNPGILSSIQAGGSNGTDLRLDLGMPLATALDDGQVGDGPAFCAFSALYGSRFAPHAMNPTDPGLRFNYLAFGRRGPQRQVSPVPGPPIVGAFDFEQPPSNGWDALWPSAGSILRATLPALGDGMAAKSGRRPEAGFEAGSPAKAAGLAPAFPSVGFRAIADQDGTGFRIVQRVLLGCTGEASGIDETRSDLRARCGIIQLRAPGRVDQDGVEALRRSRPDRRHPERVGLGRGPDSPRHRGPGMGCATVGCVLQQGRDKEEAFASLLIGDGAGPVDLLAGAIGAMSLVRTDLAHLMPAQPHSALPALTLAEETKREKHFAVFAQGVPRHPGCRVEGRSGRTPSRSSFSTS